MTKKDIYDVELICTNCGKTDVMEVPYDETTEDYLRMRDNENHPLDNECRNCGFSGHMKLRCEVN